MKDRQPTLNIQGVLSSPITDFEIAPLAPLPNGNNSDNERNRFRRKLDVLKSTALAHGDKSYVANYAKFQKITSYYRDVTTLQDELADQLDSTKSTEGEEAREQKLEMDALPFTTNILCVSAAQFAMTAHLDQMQARAQKFGYSEQFRAAMDSFGFITNHCHDLQFFGVKVEDVFKKSGLAKYEPAALYRFYKGLILSTENKTAGIEDILQSGIVAYILLSPEELTSEITHKMPAEVEQAYLNGYENMGQIRSYVAQSLLDNPISPTTQALLSEVADEVKDGQFSDPLVLLFASSSRNDQTIIIRCWEDYYKETGNNVYRDLAQGMLDIFESDFPNLISTFEDFQGVTDIEKLSLEANYGPDEVKRDIHYLISKSRQNEYEIGHENLNWPGDKKPIAARLIFEQNIAGVIFTFDGELYEQTIIVTFSLKNGRVDWSIPSDKQIQPSIICNMLKPVLQDAKKQADEAKSKPSTQTNYTESKGPHIKRKVPEFKQAPWNQRTRNHERILPDFSEDSQNSSEQFGAINGNGTPIDMDSLETNADFLKLFPLVQNRIRSACQRFNKGHGKIKKLKGHLITGEIGYAKRVGDLRVVMTKNGCFQVERIRNRDEVYKY